MVFVESPPFAVQVGHYLTEVERLAMEVWLMFQPDSGVLIPGTGGLRKLRWPSRGKGKRGGVRIIYYWAPSRSSIYLAAIYAKAKTSDVPRSVLGKIRHGVQEWLNEKEA
jgi:mRNA-degrading endonuclease RelE of RelBE toxin-antitoxin system